MMQNAYKFLNCLTIFLSGIGALFWLVVGIRIAAFPENHTGVDFSGMQIIFLTGIIFASINYFKARDKKYILYILFCGLSMALLATVIKLNILLPYETWLNLGMPERAF